MNAVATPSTRNPFAMAELFFADAIANQALAHAYVLKGKAYGAMYNLALRVAQVVNCTNRPQPNGSPLTLAGMACGQCTNCRWVDRNAHPAVLTISRHTYQVSDSGKDLSPDELEKLAKKASVPTQIKVEQIDRLLTQLNLSSEYVRVMIFTDAEELPASIPSEAKAPYEWAGLEANEEKSFHIRPLERKVFNQASANRFLKTLEEPLPHTLFFFITETEEQLLDTIVSRCQVVPCLTGEAPAPPTYPPEYFAFLETLMTRLHPSQDVYALASEFENFFVTQSGLNLEQGLAVWQDFLRRRFLDGALDETGFTAYRNAQQTITQAQRLLASKTHEKQTLVDLFLHLSR